LLLPSSLSHPFLHSFPTRRSSDLLYFLVSSQSKKPFTPSKPFRPWTIVFCCSRVNWLKGTVVGMPACLENRRSSFCAHSYCGFRSEEHTSELQSRFDLVCRLLLEK